MNQISFKRDFAYKFIKPTSFINDPETAKIILPLWRLNRLSLIRAYVFLDSFFDDVTLKKKSTVRLKYKRSDKKTHRKTIFFFHIRILDTHFFLFWAMNLPEPIYVTTTTGYIIVYPMNHFVISIPVNDHKQAIFIYRIIPYLKLLKDAKIY